MIFLAVAAKIFFRSPNMLCYNRYVMYTLMA
jgi:hypothetical protein